MDQMSIAPGETGEAKGNVFAGAKEVNTVDLYAEKYGIPKFDLLIDWGWFYFLTKPIFLRSALAARPDRQHGACDHRPDLRAEAHRAAAGLQVLCVDGAHEGTAAGDWKR